MRTLFLAILLAMAMSAISTAVARPAGAAPANDVVASDRARVLQALADLLRDDFVAPDAGAAYAARLRGRSQEAAFVKAGDDEAFADAVTSELQAIHPDAHLRVYAPVPGGTSAPIPGAPAMRSAPPKPIAASGWLDDGVAYIAFNVFFGQAETLREIRQFLDAHASARVLVLDLRQHRGGELAEMDVLFPYLFAHETTLVGLDSRIAVEAVQGPDWVEGPTIRRVEAPAGLVRREHVAVPGADTPLRSAKVYVLTSPKTASAGEHLALALKRTRRATLIGETTHGAGNYGDFFPLPSGYKTFVTVGRAFDPDTGLGWEGVGIAPDVKVPAREALREALRDMGRDESLAEQFDEREPS